jgi:hypothetical protein
MLDHLVVGLNYILVWLFFIHEDLWKSLEMDKESYTQVFARNWIDINGFKLLKCVVFIIERSCFNDLKLVMSSSKVVKISKFLPPLANDLVMKFIWPHLCKPLYPQNSIVFGILIWVSAI